MHTVKLTIPKLQANLSKTCPSAAERQRVTKALSKLKDRDALKKELEAAMTKLCRSMVASGAAGWANDPALSDAVLVQKNTGVRILSVDLSPIRLMSKIIHPPQAFPWSTFMADLETADFEKFIPFMYLDTGGNVTVGIGHHIVSEANALKIHNGRLPFSHKNGSGRASDKEVVAEYNKLKGLKATKTNAAAGGFASLTSLDVTQADASALALDDAKVRVNEIRANPFPEFDSYPKGVQMAIADLVFSMGAPRFRNGFPVFQKAVFHRDWITACQQSSRSDVSQDRNTAVADMFDAAIAAEKFFITTDPASSKKRVVFTTEAKLKPITLP